MELHQAFREQQAGDGMRSRKASEQKAVEGLIDLIPIFRHMPFLVTNGVDRHSQVVAKGV